MDTLFPSLPNPADLTDVFKMFPHLGEPLMALVDVILRDESPLTQGERELLFAHVSGLNACRYCYGAHTNIANAFGINKDLFEAMQANFDTADVPEKLKPMLGYVSKLTTTPAQMVPADAQPVYDAGWNERALHDAIAVCAIANFMNRFVDGTGCLPEAMKVESSGSVMDSYVGWGRTVGFID